MTIQQISLVFAQMYAKMHNDGATNSHAGPDRAVLPSLVTAKLAVYEAMRERGWSKVKLASELGTPENSVRRLLDLRHASQMWAIDEALAKMNAELPIDLPKVRPSGRAALIGEPSYSLCVPTIAPPSSLVNGTKLMIAPP
jgi:hypothetical protein